MLKSDRFKTAREDLLAPRMQFREALLEIVPSFHDLFTSNVYCVSEVQLSSESFIISLEKFNLWCHNIIVK